MPLTKSTLSYQISVEVSYLFQATSRTLHPQVQWVLNPLSRPSRSTRKSISRTPFRCSHRLCLGPGMFKKHVCDSGVILELFVAGPFPSHGERKQGKQTLVREVAMTSVIGRPFLGYSMNNIRLPEQRLMYQVFRTAVLYGRFVSQLKNQTK